MTDSVPATLRADDVPEEDGLLFAVQMDGVGGGKLLHWADIANWDATHGPLWIHVDAGSPRVHEWLEKESGLTSITIEALLDPSARPRTFQGKSGYVVILRGINLNEGAEPEDMVAMRLWCDGDRVISLRHEYLRTPRVVLDELLGEALGPTSAPVLFEHLISRVIDYVGLAIDEYEERMESIEGRIDDGDIDDLRGEVSELRQDLVFVRRYMAPQVSAMQRMLAYPPGWMAQNECLLMRESADQFDRYLEDLDQIRERALVAKDDLTNRQNERMNQNMYVLSIVAAIFLPLGFLTGLFGINVGGMPGVADNDAFWIVTGAMAAIMLLELWIFRKLRWL
jgi:zinc transporter|tara:strand:+ start:36169 stop:37185 length:1017 start_codon:yes stop_codon:yes gene_type:complete